MERLLNDIKRMKNDTNVLLNVECRKLFYKIGSFLHLHPDAFEVLYESLYQKYGNTIIFSKRSLYYCRLFYIKYHGICDVIPSNMNWNNIIVLLRKHYVLDVDINIFNIIRNLSLSNKEISFFLNNGIIVRFNDENINNIDIEFLKLTERLE